MMTTFLIVGFSFIAVTIATGALQIEDGIVDHSECLENYMQQVISVSRDYEHSVLACYDKDNINRRPTAQLDAQTEMEIYKYMSQKTCSSLTACNVVTNSFAFFNCYSQAAEENAITFYAMQLNASSMALELNDQYDQEQKEVLRCQLLAKRNYLTASSVVYKKHLDCLYTFK